MKVSCTGDVGVDRYPSLDLQRPGGCSLNFAANFRSLRPHAEVKVISAVGQDAQAEQVLREMRTRGIEPVCRILPGSTSSIEVVNGPGGERFFQNYDPGVLKGFTLRDFGDRQPQVASILRQSDLVMAVLYGQLEPFFLSVHDQMLSSSGVFFAADFSNLSDFQESTKIVQRLIGRVDAAFFGLNLSQDGLIHSIQRISAQTGKLMVVTLGAEGSLAFVGREQFRVNAVSVSDAVDTTGAGDSFAAAFLAEYLSKRSIQECLESASAHAARIVRIFGAFI